MQYVRTHQNSWIGGLLILALLFALFLTLRFVEGEDYWQYRDVMAESVVSPFSALGEFRMVLTDYLLILSDYYWHQGRWYYVPAVFELILRLEPGYLPAWSMLGWFYAFNYAEVAEGNERKTAFEDKGLRILREGTRLHHNQPDLYFDIAWIYFKKRKDYRRAAFYLSKTETMQRNFETMRLHAICLFRLGRIQEAEKVLTDYQQKHPENERIHREIKNFQEQNHPLAA